MDVLYLILNIMVNINLKRENMMNQKRKTKNNAHILEREGIMYKLLALEVNCTSRSSVLGHYLRHYRDSLVIKRN